MKKLLMAAALALLPMSVVAQDFDKGLAAYDKSDYATAIHEWGLLARQGHSTAQCNLGFMYEHGVGVPQNHVTAVNLYIMAAEQGNSDAQYNLGAMYGNGFGVPRDYVRAYMWFSLSAALGVVEGGEDRDVVAQYMTQQQLNEAFRNAGICLGNNYKGC